MFIVINNSTQVDSNSECGTTEKSKSGIDIDIDQMPLAHLPFKEKISEIFLKRLKNNTSVT